METSIQIPRQETCETCKGSGAAPGHLADRLPAVRRPRADPLPAGLLHRRADLPPVRRRGAGHHQGVPGVPRATATCPTQRKLTVRIPAGIASGQRLRLYGEGEAGPAAARPATSTSSSTCRSTSCSAAKATTCSAACRSRSRSLALGGEISVPTLDRAGEDHGPRGHQSRPGVPAARQGHAERVGPRRAATCTSSSRCVTPKKLTKEQRHLLEQLGKTMPRREAEAGQAARRPTRTGRVFDGSRTSSVDRGRRSCHLPPAEDSLVAPRLLPAARRSAASAIGLPTALAALTSARDGGAGVRRPLARLLPDGDRIGTGRPAAAEHGARRRSRPRPWTLPTRTGRAEASGT